MKKKQILSRFMALAAAAMWLTACSTDSDLADGKADIGRNVQVKLSFEAFNADQTLTRAVAPQPQTIDLGDGLEAEVTAERDAPKPQTRSTTLYDGQYTIIALDASRNRVGQLKGTVSSGNFTKNDGENLFLTPGTYTFICFNSAVTDDGTKLLFDNTNRQPAPQDEPLIGTTTETIEEPYGTHFVTFTMKRVFGRIRLRFVTYTDEGHNLAGKLQSYHYWALKVTYNPTDNSWYTANSMPGSGSYGPMMQEIEIPESGNVTYSGIVKEFSNTTPYYQFLGDAPTHGFTPFIVGDTKFTFTAGTLHGKSAVNKKLPMYKFVPLIGSNLKPNDSYTLTIKLKSKDPLLLFQDGTVGYYGDRTTTRMPIGLVVTEKTVTEKGMAMALKNYGTGVTGTDYYEYLIRGTSENFDDMHGYDYTWTTNYYASPAAFASFGKTVPTFPPGDGFGPTYYAAGHYIPDVTVTGANVGKWFLPSAGQWKKTLMKFGNLVMPSSYTMTYPKGSQIPWSSSELVTAFTNAGATLPFDKPYAVSGTINGNGVPVFLYLSASGIAWGWDMYCNSIIGYALPFVHF